MNQYLMNHINYLIYKYIIPKVIKINLFIFYSTKMKYISPLDIIREQSRNYERIKIKACLMNIQIYINYLIHTEILIVKKKTTASIDKENKMNFLNHFLLSRYKLSTILIKMKSERIYVELSFLYKLGREKMSEKVSLLF